MAKINVCDYCEIKLGEMEEQSKEAPKSTDDIIANLVARVAQLERELTDSKRDIETWAQEVETLRYTNTELYSRLGHVEQDTDDLDEKVEMVIDDIVTLDERTTTGSITEVKISQTIDGKSVYDFKINGNPPADSITEIFEKIYGGACR